MKNKDIEKALIKRATGFESFDVALEYSVDENENLKLTKKKVTKKFISPDISAAKALLEFYGSKNENEFANLTDEELAAEKNRLLKILQNYKESDNENNQMPN